MSRANHKLRFGSPYNTSAKFMEQMAAMWLDDAVACQPFEPSPPEIKDDHCPCCGYGVTDSGLTTVHQPALVIEADVARLCDTCRCKLRLKMKTSKGRRAGEPLLSPMQGNK